ncbi:TIGR04283 family arsenosugar biosynthesis glycosyltransferase [Halalkalibaculum sp. DA3122]|uniref:TIGR04283 family arsenosugar biosynthesis glycosyltransferase n=1 Tax=unclassified Halalkalibaculum TaxID=2964617 RepID=UPI003754C5E2
MKISVIIPTLNEEDMIGRTIRAVKKRSGGYLEEIIVVDGGSADRTISRANQAGATRVLQTAEKGRARQMNKGARHASSEILYFLHADTIPPHQFDVQVAAACQRGATAGCFRLAFDRDHPLLNFYAWCTRFDLNAFRFGDQSLFTTRTLFTRTGGFDADLLVMEDNMMVRKIKKLDNFEILPEQVTTSARKYERVGVVRLQLIFTLIYGLFFLGISQELLVRIYKKLI